MYKPEYIARMSENGTPVEISSFTPVFSKEDVRSSSVKEYGAFYLVNNIAQKTGLLASLEEAAPTLWQELFMLACSLISSGDPFLYCESWISDTECLPVGNMSSQRISELLMAMTSEERELFYQSWCTLRSEQEYLALEL
ncbi:MAG: hypothetical protein NTZ74_09645, partial [Chloroflexi bacterium]|nr:hypothetical protein [Chloroflexota bacterium]